MAISQTGKPTSGWGLSLEHSLKSQFVASSNEKDFLYAAQKLIAMKLSTHSVLNDESKKEALRNLSKFFTKIWFNEKLFEQKMEFTNERVCQYSNFQFI